MALIASILSKFDDSGIKHAKKAFGGLKGTIGALGVGIGLKALTDGLLDAAKAASADQKSMQLLNNQLKRNAGATAGQIKQNDKFIDTLSNQVGIVDDELRPAMGQLVRATGSVSQSQKLLRLALDASAATGKPLNTVTRALSNAFVGNKTQLTRLFPALKESKDLFGDLQRQVAGTAEQQATPFSKFSVALDNLKEQLGTIILPYLVDFMDTLMQPGGMIDQIGQFFEQASNPKTEVGKAFRELGDTVKLTGANIQALFGLMDPNGKGNAMNGFASFLKGVSDTLGTITDGLTMTAGVMEAIGSGNFGRALDLLNADVGVAAKAVREKTSTEVAKANIYKGMRDVAYGEGYGKYAKGLSRQMAIQQQQQVVVNVQSADPKAVVDAISKYVKQNGAVPGAWSLNGRG